MYAYLSVKRFERSNGLDTALYKTILFFYPTVKITAISAIFDVFCNKKL